MSLSRLGRLSRSFVRLDLDPGLHKQPNLLQQYFEQSAKLRDGKYDTPADVNEALALLEKSAKEMSNDALYNAIVAACQLGYGSRVLTCSDITQRLRHSSMYPAPLPHSLAATAARRRDALKRAVASATGESSTDAAPSASSTDAPSSPPPASFRSALALFASTISPSSASPPAGSNSSSATASGAVPDAVGAVADYGVLTLLGGGFLSAADVAELATVAADAQYTRRAFWEGLSKAVESMKPGQSEDNGAGGGKADAGPSDGEAPGGAAHLAPTVADAVAIVRAFEKVQRGSRVALAALGRILKASDPASHLSFREAVDVVMCFSRLGMCDASLAALPATILVNDHGAAMVEGNFANTLLELFLHQRSAAGGATCVDDAVLAAAAEVVSADLSALREMLHSDPDAGPDVAEGGEEGAVSAQRRIQWPPAEALHVAEVIVRRGLVPPSFDLAATLTGASTSSSADGDAEAPGHHTHAHKDIYKAPMEYAALLATSAGRAPLPLVVSGLKVLADCGALEQCPSPMLDTVEVIVDAHADAADSAGASEAAADALELLRPSAADLCHLSAAAATARLDGVCLWAVTALQSVASAVGKPFEEVVASAPLSALVSVWRAVAALEEGVHTEAAEDDATAADLAEVGGSKEAVGGLVSMISSVVTQRASELSLEDALSVAKSMLPACVRATVAAESAVAKRAAGDGEEGAESSFEGVFGTLCPHPALLDAVATCMVDHLAAASDADVAAMLAYVASAASWRPPSCSIEQYEDFVEAVMGKTAAVEAGMRLREAQSAAEAQQQALRSREMKDAVRPVARLLKLQASSRTPFVAFVSGDVVSLLSALLRRITSAPSTCDEAPLMALCRVAPKVAEDSRLPVPASELITRAEDLFGEAPATALSRPYSRFATADSERERLHSRREFARDVLRQHGVEESKLPPVSHPRAPGVGASAQEAVLRAGELRSDAQQLEELLQSAQADRDADSGSERRKRERARGL